MASCSEMETKGCAVTPTIAGALGVTRGAAYPGATLGTGGSINVGIAVGIVARLGSDSPGCADVRCNGTTAAAKAMAATIADGRRVRIIAILPKPRRCAACAREAPAVRAQS